MLWHRISAVGVRDVIRQILPLKAGDTQALGNALAWHEKRLLLKLKSIKVRRYFRKLVSASYVNRRTETASKRKCNSRNRKCTKEILANNSETKPLNGLSSTSSYGRLAMHPLSAGATEVARSRRVLPRSGNWLSWRSLSRVEERNLTHCPFSISQKMINIH